MKTFVINLLKTIHTRTKPRWPVPHYDEQNQPHFLFLITPPYAGSTAIANLLDSSPRTMTLTRNAEGQRLVRGLFEKDRWSADKEVDYESVKAVWLNAFQKQHKQNPDIEVVIEKSPANMVRVEQLASQFLDYSFLANNRDPYANCASILYRRHNAENLNAIQRKEVLKKLAQSWLMRSSIVREFTIKNEVPLITYETFCDNPSSILELLDLPEGVVDTIDINAKVKVKDYEAQPISNQNARQISNLTADDIACIGTILKSDWDLMEYFGYQLR